MRLVMILSLGFTFSFQSVAENVERGGELYQQYGCVQCHGAKGEGTQEFQSPRIGGQQDWYIEKALADFGKNGVRGRIHTKKPIRMNAGDRSDLAAYVSRLK